MASPASMSGAVNDQTAVAASTLPQTQSLLPQTQSLPQTQDAIQSTSLATTDTLPTTTAASWEQTTTPTMSTWSPPAETTTPWEQTTAWATSTPTLSASTPYTSATSPVSSIISTATPSVSTTSSSSSATAASATASSSASSASTASTTSASSSSSTPKWIPGVIVGSIAFVAILAGLAFWLLRRRKSQKNQQYHQAEQFDQGGAPLASPDIFGYRRPLMRQSNADDAERQRRALIRKSIISRSSWSASQIDIAAAAAPTRRDESVSLRDDWKEWEAQMQQQKADLANQHPSMQVEEVEGADVERDGRGLRDARDERNVSPPPTAHGHEEVFPVSPVSTVSVLPPVPARSRQRPLSADSVQSDQTVTNHNRDSTADLLPTQTADPLLPRRPTIKSIRSITHRNPHTRHMSEAESPTSIYSVDLQDGRQNRAWAQYHYDD